MNIKDSFRQVKLVFVAFLFVALAGCGGGGGSAGGDPSRDIDPNAAIAVDPTKYDFLTLTEDNSATPKEVVVQNTGNADLLISNIAFFNITTFPLDLYSAQDPCGPLVDEAIALKPGENCRFRVGFKPSTLDSPVEFEAGLAIQSNARVPGVLVVRGKYERASEINVAISQINACERPDEVTVYVSLTDQAGFPIKGLDKESFSFSEQRLGGDFVSVDAHLDGFVDQESLSVSLLMDYSGSISDRDLRNMETAGVAFVQRLQPDDEAEVIKYDSKIVTMQEFTADVEQLEAAIYAAPALARDKTAFYDAIVATTTGRIAGTERSKDRKAIIILTDGEDNGSTARIDDAIDAAKADGTPLFTVGFGDAKNAEVLQELADETGGVYFDSEGSDNLEAIYVKLADLVFENQYVLRYSSALAPEESGALAVQVSAFGASASAERTISACE